MVAATTFGGDSRARGTRMAPTRRLPKASRGRPWGIAAVAVIALMLLVPAAASAEEIIWTRSVHGSADPEAGFTRIYGIAAAGAGATVAGATDGNVGGPGAGGVDAFLRRYTAAGAVEWSRQFGTSGHDSADAIASGSDAILVTGTTRGTLDGPNVGDLDAFVRRYDLDGNVLWARQFGTSASDSGKAIAGDGTGIFVGGSTYGSLDDSNSGDRDAFVRRYDLDGTLLWARQFGGAGGDFATGIAATDPGIVVVGESNGDGFVRMYDQDGAVVWTRAISTSGLDQVRAVAADEAAVSVVGWRNGFWDGDDFFSTPFISRYDLTGTLLWEHIPGGWVGSIAADTTGLIVAGQSVSRYDPSGKVIWSHGSAGSVAISPSGIYVAGNLGYGAFVRRYGQESPAGSVTVNEGAAYTNRRLVTLDIPATDPDGVSLVRISNSPTIPGQTLPYAERLTWDVADPAYGGTAGDGKKTVYVQWADTAGNWSVVKSDSIVLETVRPRITLAPNEHLRRGPAGRLGIPIRLGWWATDAHGIVRYELQQRVDDGPWERLYRGSAAQRDVLVHRDHRYQYRVRAKDQAGNWSWWSEGTATAFTVRVFQESNPLIRYSTGWQTREPAGAYGGGVRSSSIAGAKATLTFTGREVGLISARGPNRGQVQVRIDGMLRLTANLYADVLTPSVAVYSSTNSITPGTHTIEIRVAPTADSRSTGLRVDLDAIVVLR
jgi:hypothetical protein